MTATCPAQVLGLDVSEVEDGLIVLTAEGDQVHHLNGTASIIFELCDGRSDVRAITAALGKTCDAPAHESEVASCIDTLRDRALVT